MLVALFSYTNYLSYYRYACLKRNRSSYLLVMKCSCDTVQAVDGERVTPICSGLKDRARVWKTHELNTVDGRDRVMSKTKITFFC